MTGYPLTPIQSAYTLIREEADEATDPLVRSGLLRALEILVEVDEDADPGPVEDGTCYSPEGR